MKRLVLLLWLVSCGGAPKPAPSTSGCAGGDQHACLVEGLRILAKGGDTKKAVSLMEGACKAGLGEACSDLGLRLKSGNGVFEDRQKAFALFLAGDAAGDPTSSASAGLMILQGQAGPNKDLDKAQHLLERGCDGKLGWACFRLGTAWAGGTFGKKDPAKALAHFEKACDYKDAGSCLVAAQLLRKGAGAPADPNKAMSYAQRACSLGIQRACP